MPKTKTSRRKQRKITPAIRARREAADLRRERKRRRRQLIYLGIATIIGLLVIISFFLDDILRNLRPVRPVEAAPGQRIEIMADRSHIPEGETYEKYNSIPPTSGPHYDQEAEWGIYDTEVRDETVVHNLEHSGVVISYNLTDQAQIDQLKAIVQSYEASCYLILRPYSKIGEGEVAVTAWGALDRMQGVDEARIRTFINYYRGNGGWLQNQTAPDPQNGRNAPEKPRCP